MEQLVEIIKKVIEKYSNIKLEIEENKIRLRFYIKDILYKVLEVTQNKDKLQVSILDDNITKIIDLSELEELILILYKQSNAKEYTKEEVEQIKQQYVAGTKIELIKMYDLQAPPAGTKGFIDFVDDLGTIHMKWENGSTLGLVVGTDEFKIICPLCNQELINATKSEI